LVYISCKTQKEKGPLDNDETKTTINISILPEELQIEKQKKEANYIFLEFTDQSSAIASISKLIYFDDKIIILDEQKNKALLFSNSGSFISEISSSGNGPNEYLRISDILISESDSCIELLDAGAQEIIRMDKSLNHVSTKKLPFFCQKFFKSGTDEYWFFTNNQLNFINQEETPYNLIKTDINIENLEFFIPMQEEMKGFVIANPYSFTTSTQESIFSLPLDYIIYSVSEGSASEKYEINFGKHNLPQELINPLKKIKINDLPERFKVLNNVNSTDYAYMIHSVFETTQYLYLQFYKNMEIYGALFIKNEEMCKSGKIPPLFGQPVLISNDNQISTVLYPSELYKIKSTNENSTNEELDYLLSKVNEFDNPIIKQSYIN
jgi:hypothetical protein